MKIFSLLMILLAAVVIGLPAFSASKGPVSSGQTYTVLTPRGSGLDDTANIQAALNAAGNRLPPVMLSAGTYQVCSQLTITNSGTVLLGPEHNNADNGTSGPPTPSAVQLYCPTAGSFTAGQAYIQINAQYVVIKNISFVGLEGIGGAPNTDCVQLLSGGNNIMYNSFEDCFNGVHINAVNTGCCSSFNQGNRIENNDMTYINGAGILCETTTGSGCTDNFFNWNHFDVQNAPGNGFIFCGPGCGNGQILGNRIEDGGLGIEITNNSAATAAFMQIENNYFQQIEPIFISNSINIVITGNQFNCFSSSPALWFGGTETGTVYSSGNTQGACSAMYEASATTFDGPTHLNDLILVGPVYDSAATAAKLEKWFAATGTLFGSTTITPSGTTFTPVLDGGARFFELDLTANSTLADFTYHISDLYMPLKFRFKQDATGGRTVTYNAAYLNPPTIGATANLCSYAQAHMSGARIIFLGASVNNVACN